MAFYLYIKVLNRETNPFKYVNVIHEFRARKGERRGFLTWFNRLITDEDENPKCNVVTGTSGTLNKRPLKMQTVEREQIQSLKRNPNYQMTPKFNNQKLN
mgnify:CR=1 FL=1